MLAGIRVHDYRRIFADRKITDVVPCAIHHADSNTNEFIERMGT